MSSSNADALYPTAALMTDFKRGRETGRVSLFRAGECTRCFKEVPKGFKFCSRDCQEKDAKEKAEKILINLDSLMSGEHTIETKDGSKRTGKVTKINWLKIKINDKEHKFPSTVEMNNDASDYIDWAGIHSITRNPTRAE